MGWQDDRDKIGTITSDYNEYRGKPKIGMGGFGRVFEHTVGTGTKVAVKEEARSVSNYSIYIVM